MGIKLNLSLIFAMQLLGSVVGQSCQTATDQLNSDASCANAFGNVRAVLEGTRSGITRSDQLSFCTPRCISLALRLLESCIDEEDQPPLRALPDLVCVSFGTTSCVNYLHSDGFTRFRAAVETGGDCNSLATSQQCSSTCREDLQNGIDAIGCCVRELIEYGHEAGETTVTVRTVFSSCDIQDTGSCPVVENESSSTSSARSISINAMLYISAIIAVKCTIF